MDPDTGTSPEPDALRAEQLERWEASSKAWGLRAEPIRSFGMPVSEWMLEQLALKPGQRVLELAAGPGDTGFLAAERVQPGGSLLSSDAAQGMIEVARQRAATLGIRNVEFARLELEWIDLPTASVDAILCRWGLMFAVDPEAALHEARRVLRPGGRIALAVWDEPAENPWTSIPNTALMSNGHAEAPDPTAPGMFALAAPGRLVGLLDGAGFMDVIVDTVAVQRQSPSVDAFIEETTDLSSRFAEAIEGLPEADRAAVARSIIELAEPFRLADGAYSFPGRALVASASG